MVFYRSTVGLFRAVRRRSVLSLNRSEHEQRAPTNSHALLFRGKRFHHCGVAPLSCRTTTSDSVWEHSTPRLLPSGEYAKFWIASDVKFVTA